MTEKRENKFTGIKLDETIAIFDRLILNSPITIGDADYTVSPSVRLEIQGIPLNKAVSTISFVEGLYIIQRLHLHGVSCYCSQDLGTTTYVRFVSVGIDADEFNLIRNWVVDRIDAERAKPDSQGRGL